MLCKLTLNRSSTSIWLSVLAILWVKYLVYKKVKEISDTLEHFSNKACDFSCSFAFQFSTYVSMYLLSYLQGILSCMHIFPKIILCRFKAKHVTLAWSIAFQYKNCTYIYSNRKSYHFKNYKACDILKRNTWFLLM